MVISMRPFELKSFFSEWEFKAKHHMTASDVESLSLSTLLQMTDDTSQVQFDDLWLGYTETLGRTLIYAMRLPQPTTI